MSRLDAEYDPTEHHDLDRIVKERGAAGVLTHVAVCACGSATWRHTTPEGARLEHDDHRDEALGIGCG